MFRFSSNYLVKNRYSIIAYRRQHISIKAPFGVGFAVVARLSLRRRRRDFRRLRALSLVMRVRCCWVVVLLVVVMGMSLLLVPCFLALSLFLLFVFLLLFQPLFSLSNPHELHLSLLST